MSLFPGDLCVIVGHENIPQWASKYIGTTVVLLRVIEPRSVLWSAHAPYWCCSGVPSTLRVSHVCLRKIPPEQMIDARTHREDNEEEETCPAEFI